MGNVQIIVTEGGEELAVLPRREYDRLAAIAAEAEEDAGTARVIDRVKQEIAEGREAYLPAEVGRAIADGANPVRELRKWRGLSQEQLADAAGVSQSYIAGIEKGRRAGTLATLRAIAAALGVSVENFT